MLLSLNVPGQQSDPVPPSTVPNVFGAVEDAVRRGDANEFQRLLSDPSVRARYNSDGGFLLRAIAQTNAALVKAALELGFDGGLLKEVESPIRTQESALVMAAATQNGEIVDLLLAHGANPNAPDLWGKAPLGTVLTSAEAPLAGTSDVDSEQFVFELDNRSYELAGRLLAAGASIFIPDTSLRSDWERLRRISERSGAAAPLDAPLLENLLLEGRTNMVTWLLTNEWSRSQRSPEGDAVLHVAARHNLLNALAILADDRELLSATNHFGWTPLHVAFDVKNIVVAERLVRAGAEWDFFSASANGQTNLLENFVLRDRFDVNLRDGALRSALHWAALRDQVGTLHWLIARGGDVTARDRLGRTPLFVAVREGSMQSVRLLLAAGADPRTRDLPGLTLMMEAAQNGDVPMMRLLAASGADPAERTALGTALHLAVERGWLDAVKWLVKNGVPLDEFNQDRRTAVDLAVLNSQAAILEVLLSNDADPTPSGAKRTGALHVAVKQRNHEIVRRLISNGADVDARDESGDTPLHFASRNQDLEVMRMLLRRRADIEAAKDKGETPLLVAVQLQPVTNTLSAPDWPFGFSWVTNRPAARKWIATHLPGVIPKSRNLTAVDYLLSEGADVHAQDGSGRNALHLAWSGHQFIPARSDQATVDLIAGLVRHGVRIDQQDLDGNTPLHLTVTNRSGYSKTFALLQAGADLGATNRLGRTPLHLFALGRNVNAEVGALLITNKADINARDTAGDTPLHLAVRKWPRQAAEWLIQNGASIVITNHAGISPLVLKESTETSMSRGLFQPKGAVHDSFRGALQAGDAEEIRRWLELDPTLARLQYFHGESAKLLASRRGDPAIIRLIGSSDSGGPPVLPPAGFPSPFMREPRQPRFPDDLAAARNGEARTVLAALETRPEIATLENRGETLLHAAANSGCRELLAPLVKAGGDLLKTDPLGRTPLGLALIRKDVETVEALLALGATNDVFGFAAAGDLDRLQSRTQTDKHALTRRSPNGHTAFHCAVLNGRLEVAKWMHAQGVDLNEPVRNAFSPSPLHCAVYAGQREVMEWLIENGADVHVLDDYGKSLIYEAVLTQHFDLVAPLIAAGVNPKTTDRTGESALDWAERFRGQPGGDAAYELLLKAGAVLGSGRSTPDPAFFLNQRPAVGRAVK